MSPDAERRLDLRQSCRIAFPGFIAATPAQEFRHLADWCQANDVDHDVYGQGRHIAAFEAKIAALLDKPSAVFMPSGVMAQLIAVRIWTERSGLTRFGLSPTSHLVLHEREAYQAVFGLHGALLGVRDWPLAAADLAGAGQPLSCLLVELPVREAGGRLPSWDDLQALKAEASHRGVPLHLDGARLWECRRFFGRSYAAIVDGFASVYVSTYKALGGVAGAVLAGEPDFIAQARLWQRRLGGVLVHQTPMVASAAMRLDQRLAILDGCYDRAFTLAGALSSLSGVRLNPPIPQTNMMHIYFDAPVEDVLRRRDDIATRDGVWVINDPRPAETPGWSFTELYVGDALLDHDDDFVRRQFERLLVDA
jgi:threonine aldolase